ncbi:MAG: WYL domain-containing protein [Steroidobacteraceae bacterium]|jgi:predicted DNA-binding transcriptional regulator YafY|nr:WYL domain-containing protein [Steroidobacteraceae bacterium]
MARTVDTELLGLLSDGETWTGVRLAERLGVGLRTVRRAVARLRADGVILDADAGRGGGLRLARRTGVPRLRLEHDEAVGLLVALAVVESLGLPVLGTGLRPLRSKLATTFREQDRGSLGRLRRRILLGGPASPAVQATWEHPKGSAMSALQSAFVARGVVRFHYRDGSHRSSSRLVEPQYLLLNHPAWYLLGYDRHRAAGRTFRLDRIERVESTAETFQVRPAGSLSNDVQEWFQPL